MQSCISHTNILTNTPPCHILPSLKWKDRYSIYVYVCIWGIYNPIWGIFSSLRWKTFKTFLLLHQTYADGIFQKRMKSCSSEYSAIRSPIDKFYQYVYYDTVFHPVSVVLTDKWYIYWYFCCLKFSVAVNPVTRYIVEDIPNC